MRKDTFLFKLYAVTFTMITSTALLTMIHCCSEELFLTEDSIHIYSPGYDVGRNYGINLHCLWNIKSSSKIFVNFTEFDVEYHFQCDWDYVKVYDGQCADVKATKFCGTSAPSSHIHNGSICIEFVSDYAVTKPGFEVVIKPETESPDLHSVLHSTPGDMLKITATTAYASTATMSDGFYSGATEIIPTPVDDAKSTATPVNATPTNNFITSGIPSSIADTIIPTVSRDHSTSIASTITTPVNPTLDDTIVATRSELTDHSPIDNIIMSSTIYNHPTSITSLPLNSINVILSSSTEIQQHANEDSAINKPTTIHPTTADTVSVYFIATSLQRDSSISPSLTDSGIIVSSSIKTYPTPIDSSNNFETIKNNNTVTESIIKDRVTSTLINSELESQNNVVVDISIVTRQISVNTSRSDSLVSSYNVMPLISINATAKTVQYEATRLTISEQVHGETLKTQIIPTPSLEILKDDFPSSLPTIQPSNTADSSQWNTDVYDINTEYLSEVMPSTIILSSNHIPASYVLSDKTTDLSYRTDVSPLIGNTLPNFTSLYTIHDLSPGKLVTNKIDLLSPGTPTSEDYTASHFSSLTIIDASQVLATGMRHANIISKNFLDSSLISATADFYKEKTYSYRDDEIFTQPSASMNSNVYEYNNSYYVNTSTDSPLVPSSKETFTTSDQTWGILQFPSISVLNSNQIRSNSPSAYDTVHISTTKVTGMAFRTASVQPHSSSAITTLLEDETVSQMELSVACHITEQILLDDSGKITMDVPFQGVNLACTWLLLAKINRVIHLNITYKSANPFTECQSNHFVVYDGVYKRQEHLGKLCNNSTQSILSSGHILLLELVSTKGPVSVEVLYNVTKNDQSCVDHYSLCGGSDCLPSEWWCDNEIDCPNSYDEQKCSLCSSDEYRCGNGQCIQNILKCNGRYDCIDGSDETDCATIDNKVLRVRYGSIWLPVCGDNWNDSMGNSLCKYLSYESSFNSNIIASSHNVSMSIKYGPTSTGIFKLWRPITSCQTEVRLNCSKQECGKRSSNLIVPYIIGGSQSYRGQWPWVVAITVGGNFVCGGTLVSPTWVVTAGHCLQNVISIPHMISVVLGTTFKDGRNGTVLNVVEIIIHHDFDSINNADIALLRLKKPAEINDYTHKICLPYPGYILPRNLVCYIAGWGATDPSDKSVHDFPDSLRHAKVNIWSNTKCNNVYSSEINENMICAGLLGGGVDTCQGDSGGPLMCSKDNKIWQLVGITSWGNPVCGAPNSPGVYTSITSYSSWIWSALENEGKLGFEKCDFEGPGICGIQDISEGQFSWTKRTGGWTFGGQPLTDSTLKTKEGHFIYADTYLVSGEESSNAVLQLMLNKTSKEKCLTFAYHFYGSHSLRLKVKAVITDVAVDLWTLSIISASWKKTEVEIPSGATELKIIGVRNSISGNGGVAVDDIFLVDDRCIDMLALSCNFDNGHACGYTNYTDDTDHWVLEKSSSFTTKDWFLKYSSNDHSAGGKARLLSPIMQSRGPRCFTFRYKLCMPYANSLSILLGFVFNDVKYFGSSLWTRSTSDETCLAWTKGSVNIPFMPLEHFIAVEVERKFLNNDVFVDNLVMYNGNCIT